MAITARNQLKQWFETGDYPTQEQFANWLDSFWHKTDELIPMNRVEGLEAAFSDFINSVNLLIPAVVPNIEGTFDTAAVKRIEIPAGAIYAGLLIRNLSESDELTFFIEVLDEDLTTTEYLPETTLLAFEKMAEEQRIFGPCTIFITTLTGSANFKIFK